MNKSNSDYLQRDHRVRAGRLRYTSKKPERMDEERGRESWTMVIHDDGRRSLQAHSEIDDRPSVLRFVQVNMNPDYSPADAAVRITVGDEFFGSGWFHFHEHGAECETYTKLDGRLSQRWESGSRIRCFGAHAIQNDAWVTHLVDRSRTGELQTMPVMLSSPDHRGATGPQLVEVTPSLIFVGEEETTVAAGTFASWHFQFAAVTNMPEEHPPYDVWTTTDGDYIMLKAQVAGYMQTYYELVELRDSF